MALEKIKSEKVILALKPGAGRLNDGGGLYLVPYAWGQTHSWRMDYSFQGHRKTLSLGVHPQVGLNEARALVGIPVDRERPFWRIVNNDSGLP